jgi:TIR domain
MESAHSSSKTHRVFISYSWDGHEHKSWVKELATRLRSDGIDVTLDVWHVAPGDQLPKFMETAVRDNDFVVIICTPKYKERSDARKGGVGYEGDIMTGEVLIGQNERKFIPILRDGEWKNAAPSWLASKFFLNLRGAPYSEDIYQDLVNTVCGTTEKAPPLGTPPATTSGMRAKETGAFTPPPPDTGPIRIKGIVVDDIGTPRNDGTAGCALYRVPFQLSRRPSPEWAAHFVRNWDRPPSYSGKHRPRIASVVGDRVILDGTTVEEVETHHRDTLKLVIDKVNQDIAEYEAKQRRAEETRAEQERQHKESASEAAKRITFD